MDKYKNLRIEFDLRENDENVCYLRIIDGHIKVFFSKKVSDFNKQELSSYFSENIPNWETTSFTRETGGSEIDENNNVKFWDGVEIVKFSDNPYETLMYIFVSKIQKDKNDKFNMKYIITLKFQPDIDIKNLK